MVTKMDLLNCDEDNGSDQESGSAISLGDAPFLVSKPGVRCSERANRAPERYDPSSGESSIQLYHNIISQVKEEHSYLGYDDSETKFIAHVITKLCKDCYAQQFMI